MKVNPFKIIGWVGLAIAVVGAFTEIPYAGLLLVLLGLAGGYAIAAEDHVRVLVSALVLTSALGVLAGGLVAEWVSPRVLRWVAGAGFVAIGMFILLRGEGGP